MANESVRIWTAVLTAMAAVLLTAGSVLGAAGANAVGACTGIMNQGLVQYSQCATNSGAHCTSSLGNFAGGHVTCTYPDGGRDECDYRDRGLRADQRNLHIHPVWFMKRHELGMTNESR